MKPAYVLMWQSPSMTAPAYWYYRSRYRAELDRVRMRPSVKCALFYRDVPDNAPMMDEADHV